MSLAIINLSLEQATDRESLNAYLQQMALSSALHRQIDFSASTELVSSDMVGSRFAGIVDPRPPSPGITACSTCGMTTSSGTVVR